MPAPLSFAGPRLLAALLLAGSGVVLGQLPAHACTCATTKPQTQASRADDVFTGTVTDVTSKGKATSATTTYAVEVDRVYKGDITTRTVDVTSEGSGPSCGLDDLVADKKYVFFVKADGAALTTDRCSGTAPAKDAVVTQVEKLLGDGHAAVPPAPAQAEFTRVVDAEPTSLPRLAAPGVALVLVGLLGLVVVRRLGKRA
ncbi:hypothetical protein ACT8ZV_14730 [Nocardioides sp. MAHUQ-72]|uniref:hypothetical protein n=1 Tax=unclassified Nocardioides TaxID=2615069 RepID=UPI003619BEC9